jgi:hypothetical protein
MGKPRPPGLKVQLRSVADCPLCRETLRGEESLAECGACLTVYHEECFTEFGGCATLGCAAKGRVEPTGVTPAAAQRVRPAFNGRLALRSIFGAGAAVSVAGLAVFGVGTLFKSGWHPAFAWLAVFAPILLVCVWVAAREE